MKVSKGQSQFPYMVLGQQFCDRGLIVTHLTWGDNLSMVHLLRFGLHCLHQQGSQLTFPIDLELETCGDSLSEKHDRAHKNVHNKQRTSFLVDLVET